MSFFSRKPNPPSLQAIIQAKMNAGAMNSAPAVKSSLAGGAGVGMAPATQANKPETEQAPSNARFRSFAERYVVERCRDWPEKDVDARAWEAILQARTIYNKVKEVGRTLGPDQ